MVRVILAAVAIVALIGGAYLAGAPAGSGGNSGLGYSLDANPAASAGPASLRMGALGVAGNLSDKSGAIGAPGEVAVPAVPADAGTGSVGVNPDQTLQLTTIEAAQIV